MENFLKALLISMLMSGSFMIQAAEDKDSQAPFGVTVHAAATSEFKEHTNVLEDLKRQVMAVAISLEQENLELRKQLTKIPFPFLRPQNLSLHFSEPERPLVTGTDFVGQIFADLKKKVFMIISSLEQENLELRKLLAQQREKQILEDRALAERLDRRDSVNVTEEQSIKFRIYQKTRAYSKGKERPIIEGYLQIFGHLHKISQGSDVHALDDYVFGTQKMIDTLLKVGRLYNIDNPKLTLAQVGQNMSAFVTSNEDFFSSYQYEETTKTSAEIITILNSHFSAMDAEVVTIAPSAPELWSRAWTLALELYDKDKDIDAIRIIFDQAIGGHLTKGGSLGGRINRGFVGYVALLAKSGVNLY